MTADTDSLGGVGATVAGGGKEPAARERCATGDRLVAEGREAEAEAAYREAVALGPSSGDAHHRLAVVLYKRGEFQEARTEAERATALSPSSVDAWFALGLILKDARESAAAVHALDRALQLQPAHVPAHHYRGRALYQAGRPQQALLSLQRASELAPGDAHIAHDLAIAHVACGNWRAAEEWFGRCIGLEPHNADTYYQLGQAHEHDVTTPDADAETAYRRAVELNPEHLPALFRLAVLWARRRHADPDTGARALSTLRQMAAREDLTTLLPDAHLVHYLQGALLDDDPAEVAEAERAYRRCLELHPDFAPAHNNLGIMFLNARDLETAAECFKQAVLCDPHCDSALHNLCRLWYDQPGEMTARQIADLVDLAPEGAPDAISGLMGHLVDAARSDAFASSYDRIHEIKNLLAILGARMRKALAPLQSADPSEAREVMELYDRAFEAIRGYLSAIHSPPAERETLDCGETVERALRQLLVAKPPNVVVEKHLEPGLPPLFGDRRRLTQLFQNLATNAFEALPDGGVLRVVARGIGPGGAPPGATVRRGVRVTFEDTGRGMTDEQLRRAFDPGYTTKESGSGYGLAVAGQVAREHGGTCWLERGKEGGTRATVELPERPQPEAPAQRLRLRPIMFEDWRRLVPSELDAIGPADGSPARGAETAL